MHYLQCELSSVYAKHTTLTSRNLIFVIWQNFAIQKKKGTVSLRIAKKKTRKPYKEAQQVELFYSIAFVIKTKANFPSSVLLFIVPLLPVLLCNYSCTYFYRDSYKERRTDCIYWSVSPSAKIRKTEVVCVCKFEALWSTKNVMVI